MNCPDSGRFEALLSLYTQTHGEITHYRDYEWKITVWGVLLLGAISGLTRVAPFQPTHKGCMQTILCVVTVAITLYHVWHIHFVHKNLTWNRQLRRRLERVFRLYDPSVYGNENILPAKWKTEKPRYWDYPQHLVSFWGLIILIAAYALYSIVCM